MELTFHSCSISVYWNIKSPSCAVAVLETSQKRGVSSPDKYLQSLETTSPSNSSPLPARSYQLKGFSRCLTWIFSPLILSRTSLSLLVKPRSKQMAWWANSLVSIMSITGFPYNHTHYILIFIIFLHDNTHYILIFRSATPRPEWNSERKITFYKVRREPNYSFLEGGNNSTKSLAKTKSGAAEGTCWRWSWWSWWSLWSRWSEETSHQPPISSTCSSTCSCRARTRGEPAVQDDPPGASSRQDHPLCGRAGEQVPHRLQLSWGRPAGERNILIFYWNIHSNILNISSPTGPPAWSCPGRKLSTRCEEELQPSPRTADPSTTLTRASPPYPSPPSSSTPPTPSPPAPSSCTTPPPTCTATRPWPRLSSSLWPSLGMGPLHPERNTRWDQDRYWRGRGQYWTGHGSQSGTKLRKKFPFFCQRISLTIWRKKSQIIE